MLRPGIGVIVIRATARNDRPHDIIQDIIQEIDHPVCFDSMLDSVCLFDDDDDDDDDVVVSCTWYG